MQMQTNAAARTDELETVQGWLDEARQTGQGDTYAGKRRYPRYTWTVPVVIEVLDGELAGESDYASSRDISEGGLGIRLRRRIPDRSMVRVTTDEYGPGIHARVMHCTETLGGFILGLEFAPAPQCDAVMRQSA
ncbi:MAG: PilZ domain-containing protein [bacterium]|nr:PilZ domain-containing protein [bacterium]